MKSHPKAMNRLIFTLFTLFLISTAQAQDPVWVASSDLKEVKIYQNGAMVSRSAHATVNPGLQQVVLSGLSPYINAQSVNVKGTGDATILSVQFQQNYLKEQHKSKEVENLESLLDSLDARYKQINNRIGTINELQAALQANKSIGGANNGVVADELELFIDYYNKKSNALKDELIDCNVRLKKLSEQMGKINSQLDVLRFKYNLPSGNIIVNLDAKTKGVCSFDYSYVIESSVSWVMMYDLRVKDVSSPVEVLHRAKVNQQCGEDWIGAHVILSTGNPMMGSTKPELTPWYLSFQEPIQPQVARGGVAYDMAAVPISAMAKMEMKEVQVQLNQQQLNNEYEISQPYTIKGDGQDYYCEIQRQQVAATYHYVAVPKLDPTAYLTARIANFGDLGLTPGEANIYFDGAYVGQTYVNPGETEDSLELSLGRDERITIKREKMKDFSGNKLFGGNRERSFSYDISVKNKKKTAIDLELQDQLPISNDKEIEVRDPKYSGGNYDAGTGKITWKISLAPGLSDKKQLSYTVRYPKEKHVSGL